MEEAMNRIIVAALISSFGIGSAMAQSCESKAVSKDGKPLSGAAKTSFVKKCCEDSAVSKDGKRLLENLQPFPSDRRFKAMEPSDVAARMREVRDETASNRVGHLGETDRDRACDRLQR